MSASWGGYFYERPKTRKAVGGIRIHVKGGEIAGSWWGKRWMEALESFGWHTRLERGRRYARSGQVTEVHIEPGGVRGAVQGSRAKPYAVRIGLHPIARKDWARVAQTLDLPAAQVEGVVSFYTLFKTKPAGRHVIWLCQTLSCDLAGTRRLLGHLERRYSLRPGGTTADGRFTLTMAECLGGCGTGPAMMVNWDYHDRLTPERVDEVLARYE